MVEKEEIILKISRSTEHVWYRNLTSAGRIYKQVLQFRKVTQEVVFGGTLWSLHKVLIMIILLLFLCIVLQTERCHGILWISERFPWETKALKAFIVIRKNFLLEKYKWAKISRDLEDSAHKYLPKWSKHVRFFQILHSWKQNNLALAQS